MSEQRIEQRLGHLSSHLPSEIRRVSERVPRLLEHSHRGDVHQDPPVVPNIITRPKERRRRVRTRSSSRLAPFAKTLEEGSGIGRQTYIFSLLGFSIVQRFLTLLLTHSECLKGSMLIRSLSSSQSRSSLMKGLREAVTAGEMMVARE